MEMNQITVSDADLRKGAEEGMDAFLKVFIDKYLEVTGGKINADTMPLLNGYQHTLLGYHFFREEVMEGGFVQLIQNGYGPYIFDNPFAKAMRMFGAKEFSKLIYEAKKIYDAHRADLEKERTEEEFMAMYEQYEAFDDLEEQYMEEEEQITAQSISFPYRLEQGPARGKNAIALLGNMGIDEKIVKQAERRAAEFETTGSWEKNKFLR